MLRRVVVVVVVVVVTASHLLPLHLLTTAGILRPHAHLKLTPATTAVVAVLQELQQIKQRRLYSTTSEPQQTAYHQQHHHQQQQQPYLRLTTLKQLITLNHVLMVNQGMLMAIVHQLLQMTNPQATDSTPYSDILGPCPDGQPRNSDGSCPQPTSAKQPCPAGEAYDCNGKCAPCGIFTGVPCNANPQEPAASSAQQPQSLTKEPPAIDNSNLTSTTNQNPKTDLQQLTQPTSTGSNESTPNTGGSTKTLGLPQPLGAPIGTTTGEGTTGPPQPGSIITTFITRTTTTNYR